MFSKFCNIHREVAGLQLYWKHTGLLRARRSGVGGGCVGGGSLFGGCGGGGVFLVWGGMLGGAIEFCVLELVWASNFVGVGLSV